MGENAGLPAAKETAAAEGAPATADAPAELCWQERGIFGDRSCAELARHTHCRNCPSFSSAARHLLDRPIPADYQEQWTASLARKDRDLLPGRVSGVLFRLGTDWFALPTAAFQEVADRRRVHSLPHRSDGLILGLVNVRGELLICASLYSLLGLELPGERPGCLGWHDRFLVGSWEAGRLVFPVEEVHGVERFQPGELHGAPASLSRSFTRYIQGVFLWRGKAVAFLDPAPVFSALNRSLT
ncbi:MAG TPA: chemotaxis protein CheW [Verrucomicrobiae bacterium]|nr:chemotaxis protein CheW [Verrucomicrobiae bacterium]